MKNNCICDKKDSPLIEELYRSIYYQFDSIGALKKKFIRNCSKKEEVKTNIVQLLKEWENKIKPKKPFDPSLFEGTTIFS